MREVVADRRPLSEQVADILTKRILDQGLVPGDRLPTESELIEEFQVSRTVIREAGRTLVARGIVSIRPRRGMLVADFDQRNLSRQMAIMLRLGGGTFEQLMELRKAIEPDATAYAAMRRTEGDVIELRRLVALLEYREASTNASPELPPGVQVQADLGFHSAIAKASKNPFFVHMAMPIHEILSVNYLNSPGYASEQGKTHREHSAIAEAIADGDPDLARQLAIDHIRRVTSVAELLAPPNHSEES